MNSTFRRDLGCADAVRAVVALIRKCRRVQAKLGSKVRLSISNSLLAAP
jgi:hypothetical protein